jgi:hypothetical protein
MIDTKEIRFSLRQILRILLGQRVYMIEGKPYIARDRDAAAEAFVIEKIDKERGR